VIEIRQFFCIAAAIVVNGCQSAAVRAGLQSLQPLSAPSRIPQLACPEGSTSGTFYLSPANADTLTAASFGLPNRANGAPVRIYSVSETRTVRLDVCTWDDGSGERIDLKQVILVGMGGGAEFGVVSVEANATVRGLEQAIFQFDYANLLIDVPYGETIDANGLSTPTTHRLLIKGNSEVGHFVAALALTDRPGGGDLISRASHAFVGTIEYGDPISVENCPSGRMPEYRRFDLGDAKFHVKTCVGVGTSGTRAYMIHTVTLLDPSPHVPEGQRGQKVTIFATDPAPGYRVRSGVRHHNVCDWFVIETPFATYSASADHRGNGGGVCEDVDPAAPTPLEDGVRFAISYRNGQNVTAAKAGEFCHNLLNWCVEPVAGKVPMAMEVREEGTVAACIAAAQGIVPGTTASEQDEQLHNAVLMVPVAEYRRLLTLPCAWNIRLAPRDADKDADF
jgi:hypothetical protein